MKINISNFFKKYLKNNNYTGVYAKVQTDKKDSGTGINFKSDKYATDMRQSEYVKAPFLDEQARNDAGKKKNKIKDSKLPWYIIPKGWSFLYEKERVVMSDGDALLSIAMRELKKEHIKYAERYFKKACEKGISLASKQRFTRIVQEYQRRHKSAVKGLKKASTRIIRAIVTPSTKSEEKGNKNYEKMRKLGLVESAEKFKENPNNHTYRICIQRKTSDDKYGVDGSYIFSSEHTNCPTNMIQRHIVDIYGRCQKDTSFERIYTIDVNGTINWYEREQLEKMLEKRVEEQNNFINQKAA